MDSGEVFRHLEFDLDPRHADLVFCKPDGILKQFLQIQGFDDQASGPANPLDLFRRLDAIQQPQSSDGCIVRGATEIDTDRMMIRWQDQPVGLTLTEFWLVHAMARYPGHVKNRQQLMDAAQAVLDDNTITSHVKRIRRKFEALDARMRTVIPPLHTLSKDLIPMIDADTNAFTEYMEGLRMPRDTEEQRAARSAKMQAGLKTAIRVPLKTMQLGDGAWDAMCDVARYGNPASKSDVQVGARALETGIWGAYQNVLINMGGIRDEAFKTGILAEAEALMDRAKAKCIEILEILDER